MSRYHSIAIALVAAVVASSAHAATITTIDQQNLVGGSWFGFVPGVTVGQSFTPTLNRIDAVEFNLYVPSDPGAVVVNLLDGIVGPGGEDGPIIGTTQSVNVTNTTPFQTYHFDFPAPVPLIPGNAYVLQLVTFSGNPRVESHVGPTNPSPYPGGTVLFFGFVRPDDDLLFTEGIHVPEPTTCGLAIIGSLALSAYAWRRRRTRT